MNRIISLVACLSFFIVGLNGQLRDDLIHGLRVDVVYLSSDYLEGRLTGTPGEMRAADYLVKRYQEIGLEPAGESGSYFQTFDYTIRANPHAEEGQQITGRNVIGYLDNGAPYTVVIGAHYDHIGMGGIGSRDQGEPAIHNGADDNASGVASLLYLAEFVTLGNFTNHNYLFIAFSGEELGLIGSKAYTKSPSIGLNKVSYMINIDMLGRMDEEKNLVVNGVGTSPAWKPALEKIKLHDIKITTTESGVGASDHTSFYLKDIPAVHFFSGLHSEYHKPSDDAALINFDGLYEATEVILALIDELDKTDKIEFSPTKDEGTQRQAAAFKVTLGVMPDYAHEAEGMRIDAVIADRAAANAGIQNGDIVLKIGEMEVKDIYDYMEGLSKFKKGDQTRVTVKRGDELIEYEVEF